MLPNFYPTLVKCGYVQSSIHDESGTPMRIDQKFQLIWNIETCETDRD